MKELKRILSNRRLLFGLVFLLLINGFLFALEQSRQNYGLDCSVSSVSFIFHGAQTSNPVNEINAKEAYAHYLRQLEKVKLLPLNQALSMLEEEKKQLDAIPILDLDGIAINHLLAQIKYLDGYSDWLDAIQKNKDAMLSFSIFNNLDSFSGRNIIKTAREFEKLQSVNLSLGADGAVNAFMSFSLTDYFLLAILLLFCVSFLKERKAGLWSVVHAAPGGRLRLAVQRMLILFGVSVCGTFLLYGTNLAIGFLMYGGTHDLSRAVQSVEALGKLTMLCSVKSFLGCYFLLRIAAAFFVSLILWLLLIAVAEVKYTVVITAGVLAAEYGLYAFLPVQSVWNGLKYFNLFTYINLSGLYTRYLNINLFGYPVSIQSVSQAALFPLCLILTAACIWIHCHKKPAAKNNLLERIAYGMNGVMDKGLCRLRLFGMELYKMLWIQKGIVIAALLIYAAMRLSFVANIPANLPNESAAWQYVKEFEGEITNDTFSRMDMLSDELCQTITEYENAKTAYENGKITSAQMNVYSYNAATARVNQEGLAIVRDRAEKLRDYGAQKGFVPWLIDEIPFESVYGTAAQSNQRQSAVVAVLGLILFLAGSMAYERQSGMAFLLGVVPRGRKTLLFCKILLSALAAVVVAAVVYGKELDSLISNFSIQTWDVPAQNLSMLAQFPIKCSIRGWLAFLYGYRLWMLFCGALLVLFISNRMKRAEAAYIACCAIMLIPSLLYIYVGIDLLEPFSYIVSMEAMSLAQFSLRGAVITIMAGFITGWLFISAGKA